MSLSEMRLAGEHPCLQYVNESQAISCIELTPISIPVQNGENDCLKFKKNTLKGLKMRCRYDNRLSRSFDEV